MMKNTMESKLPTKEQPHRSKRRSRRSAEEIREPVISLDGNPPAGFRRLESSERVIFGDYVESADASFQLWEGPTGFRADSFLKQVYRPK
jgi:hypothetical protein